MLSAVSFANRSLYTPVTGVYGRTVRSVPAANPDASVGPVEPVKAAKPVSTARNASLTGFEDRPLDRDDLLRRWECDPAANAVRSRIQYPDNASAEKTKSAAEVAEEAECQTCKKRKYQDGSDDPGVSFKTPTRVSPENAANAVRGHENEHVVRERAEAQREGRKVVSQSVTYHTAICPECGRVYVSGGETRTTTASVAEPEPQSDSWSDAAQEPVLASSGV